MSNRPEQPTTPAPTTPKRVLTPRVIALGGIVLALIAASVVWVLLAVGVSKDQLDAIRTGGTLIVGAGGAVALLLAARRQRSTELELEQKYEAAHHALIDATERRITELYIKAADQLGSDKAPVRIAGLHALERLAQDTPRLRQTIVDVICAYLRMPYTPPTTATARVPRPLARRRPIRPGRPIPPLPLPSATPRLDSADTARQEREVRLTAQAILTRHLNPGPDPDKPVETFWDSINLDLTDATLIHLNLSHSRINIAQFDRATFTGPARFTGATFTEHALFDGVTFTGSAEFDGATFTGYAWFEQVTFAQIALFHSATFTKEVRFYSAAFTEEALFGRATFTRYAAFDNATFTGTTSFNDATFAKEAWFRRVVFAGYAGFRGAAFTGYTQFDYATFTKEARFDEALVAHEALVAPVETDSSVWPAGWQPTENHDAVEGRKGTWHRLVHVPIDLPDAAPPVQT